MVCSWLLLSACAVAATSRQIEESSLIQLTNLRKELGQSLSPSAPVPVKVIGLFNTGTNIVQNLVDLNFNVSVLVFPNDMIDGYRERRLDQIMAQANDCLDGWKHIMPSFQTDPDCHKCDGEAADAVVVSVIRNPIPWMIAMRQEGRGYDLTSCFQGDDWLSRECSWPSCSDKTSWDTGNPDKGWCDMTSKCSQQTMEKAKFDNVAQLWIQSVKDADALDDFGFKKNVVIRYEDLVKKPEHELGRVAKKVGVDVTNFQQVPDDQPERCRECNFTEDGSDVMPPFPRQGCHDCSQDRHAKAVYWIDNKQHLKYLEELGENINEWCNAFGHEGKKLMCDHGYTDCGC